MSAPEAIPTKELVFKTPGKTRLNGKPIILASSRNLPGYAQTTHGARHEAMNS
jgi:hypothetical protein